MLSGVKTFSQNQILGKTAGYCGVKGKPKNPSHQSNLDLKKRLRGDLFVDQKPITRQAIIDKGYNITVLLRNSLEKHLVKLVGHGKQFDATPKKVTVKCNPDKPTPGHLIDNIKEYMGSFKKGSAPIRKIFTAANPSIIKIDHTKFLSLIHI